MLLHLDYKHFTDSLLPNHWMTTDLKHLGIEEQSGEGLSWRKTVGSLAVLHVDDGVSVLKKL